MNKKKIYIAGSGGMLGEAFYNQFGNEYELKCTDIDVNETWLSALDFRDYDAYRNEVLGFKPDFLFHLGAHTSLEYCELNQSDAYATNTIAVENAVYLSNELDIPMLYISTAGIFDGTKDIYDDWDQPNPLGHYARSKYAGEVFVEKHCRRHLICRAGWMMGSGPKKDKKFIQKIMQQLKDGEKELFVVNDKLGTPTYTHDFARNVKVLGLEGEVTVTPVNSDYWKEIYFADRPASERLIDQKLDLRGLNIMRDWRVCLQEYIDNYYRGYLSGGIR